MFRPGHSGFTFLDRRPLGVTCLVRRPFGVTYLDRRPFGGLVEDASGMDTEGQ